MDVIADYFLRESADLHPEMRLVEDLGADSLEILEITLVLNEALNIDIFEGDLAGIRTVGQLHSLALSQALIG
ncbi:phosphopantetheine-binding protein [Pseudomonas sp. NPDC090202]|uniref:phosphopantetheine-binding protein n=1 Tax=unclassified Pseudomonas TaxID=196821 RepID=UPI003821B708